MVRCLALALATLSLVGPAASSQTGLLIVAHGAGPEWNKRVRETVAQVRWSNGPVATAFLMGPEAESAGFGAGIDRLLAAGARAVVVVPLMISSAGGHYRQTRYYAGELPTLPAELQAHGHYTPPKRWPVPFRVTPALDGAPELGAIVREQWSGLSDADRHRSLVFVAHGPSDSAEAATWFGDLDRAIRPIAVEAKLAFRIGLLRDDAAPPVRREAVMAIRRDIERMAGETSDSVVVLSLLISQGTINTITIPSDLSGLPIRYRPSSLAPSSHLARWIERVAGEAEGTAPGGASRP